MSTLPPENKIILIDFDGTVVDHDYPRVGEDAPGAVTVLKHLAKENRLILWTMRGMGSKHLDDAVQWYTERGIPLFGVNENPEQKDWTNSPKAYGNYVIDDTAVGCPLIELPGMDRPVVDWHRISDMLGLYPKVGSLIPERLHRNSRWLRESVRLMSEGMVELPLADGFDAFDVCPIERVGVDMMTRRVSFTIGSESISYTKSIVGSGNIFPGVIKTLDDVKKVLDWMKGWSI